MPFEGVRSWTCLRSGVACSPRQGRSFHVDLGALEREVGCCVDGDVLLARQRDPALSERDRVAVLIGQRDRFGLVVDRELVLAGGLDAHGRLVVVEVDDDALLAHDRALGILLARRAGGPGRALWLYLSGGQP